MEQDDILQFNDEREASLTDEEKNIADRWEFIVWEAKTALGRQLPARRAIAEQKILAVSDDMLEYNGLTWDALLGLANALLKLIIDLNCRAAHEERFRVTAWAATRQDKNYLAILELRLCSERWHSRNDPFWRKRADQQRAEARAKAKAALAWQEKQKKRAEAQRYAALAYLQNR